MTQTELQTRQTTIAGGVRELDTVFYMSSIEVDGITSRASSDLHSKYFFTVKSEEDEFGNPLDTGAKQRWVPDWNVSESHWLKCGVIVPEFAYCTICGKRDMPE